MKQLVYTNRYILLLAAVLAIAALPAAAQTVGTMRPLAVTITGDGLVTSLDQATGGLYLVTVKNDSDAARGIVMKGRDLGASPYIRFSKVLQPGQSQTFRWFFPSDTSVNLRDLLRCTHVQRTCIAAGFGGMTESIGFE